MGKNSPLMIVTMMYTLLRTVPQEALVDGGFTHTLISSSIECITQETQPGGRALIGTNGRVQSTHCVTVK